MEKCARSNTEIVQSHQTLHHSVRSSHGYGDRRREFGGPEKLKAFDIPAQPVRSGQVRVDVAAAAVSPTDTIHRSGGRAELLNKIRLLYVPGMDIAGVISESARESTMLQLVTGDGNCCPNGLPRRVFVIDCASGTFRCAHRRGHLRSRHALFR